MGCGRGEGAIATVTCGCVVAAGVFFLMGIAYV